MDAGVVSGLLQTRPRGTSVEKKRLRCEGTRGKRPATAGGCGGAGRLRRRCSSPMHRGIAFVAAPCIRPRGARNAASHPFSAASSNLPEWIEDYNRSAPHSALGFLSPKEFRAQQYTESRV